MRSAEYKEYMRSPEWARKRQAVITRACGRCERCGNSGKLEVHHLHYDTFGNESLDDLQGLCGNCHGAADAERVSVARFERGMVTYAEKKYGDDWEQCVSEDELADEFQDWLDRR
jgi:5-methylcytosine-specific restriction endonuclease McrA